MVSAKALSFGSFCVTRWMDGKNLTVHTSLHKHFITLTLIALVPWG